MAGRDRADGHEKEANLPAEATSAQVPPNERCASPAVNRPERAAAQLCQLKLKYEFAPQSPSSAKRRSDIGDQPCSPSVETLLTATVRRVELEVAKELGCSETSGKRQTREERLCSSSSTECRSPQDCSGAGKNDKVDTPSVKKVVTAALLNNGSERRSTGENATIFSPKRNRDWDSPISSPVTRSQTLEAAVAEEAELANREMKTAKASQADSDHVNCNGAAITASSKTNSLSKAIIPKVVITKPETVCDSEKDGTVNETNSPKGIVPGQKSAEGSTCVNATKTELSSANEDLDEERQKQVKVIEKTASVKHLAKIKDFSPVRSPTSTSCASSSSNGACTKASRITPKKESLAASVESETQQSPLVKGLEVIEKTPSTKTLSAISGRRSDPNASTTSAVVLPSSPNGFGNETVPASFVAMDNDVEVTPKITRTAIVSVRRLDDVSNDKDEVVLNGAELISIKQQNPATMMVANGDCHQGVGAKSTTANNNNNSNNNNNNALTVVTTVKRTIREVSADEIVESTPKKFASSLLSTPSPVAAAVRRKDLDTPTLSPVMKDIPDNPSSPMTRSMSRRMEETGTAASSGSEVLTGGAGRFVQSPPQSANTSSCSNTITLSTLSSSSSCSSSSSGSGAPFGSSTSALSTPRSDELLSFKKRVRFDRVTVYLFERTQGFTSVPTQGGSTLGMGSTHQDLEEYSVEEHAERRRLLLRPQGVPGATVVLPIPTKRRRELLRRSGVRDIDALEKDECESIRASRERCGCVCQGRCEPPFCLCILAGISCQVEVYSQIDRSSFPCGCSREGCDNPNGRTEFDPVKVKAHVQQTRLRANRELGLPEEELQVFNERMEDSTCDYSSEGSDNSSVCSENSDYAFSDEPGAPVLAPQEQMALSTKDNSADSSNVKSSSETQHPNDDGQW